MSKKNKGLAKTPVTPKVKAPPRVVIETRKEADRQKAEMTCMTWDWKEDIGDGDGVKKLNKALEAVFDGVHCPQVVDIHAVGNKDIDNSDMHGVVVSSIPLPKFVVSQVIDVGRVEFDMDDDVLGTNDFVVVDVEF